MTSIQAIKKIAIIATLMSVVPVWTSTVRIRVTPETLHKHQLPFGRTLGHRRARRRENDQ